jgi:hypothetical protein
MKNKIWDYRKISIILLLFTLIYASGCDILNPINIPEEDDSPLSSIEPNIYAISAPYSGNGFISLISKNPSGNRTIAKNYIEIARTANDADIYNGYLYILHTGSNSLMKVDLKTKEKTELSVGTGNSPNEIAFYSETRGYISNNIKHTVSVVNPQLTTDAIISTITLPEGNNLFPNTDETSYAYPQGVAIDNDKVYVTLTNQNASRSPAGPGLVSIIDPITNEINKTITLNYSNAITTFQSTTLPNLLFIVQTGSYYDVSDSGIDVINTITDKIIATLSINNSEIGKMTIDSQNTLHILSSSWGAPISYFTTTFEGTNFSELEKITISESSAAYATDIKIDNQNNLYISDMSNSKVYIISDDNETEILEVSSAPQVLIIN